MMTALDTLLRALFPDAPSLSAHRWLVVAAHPDDETLGASHVLSHCSPGNATVLHLTDGAPQDPRLWAPHVQGPREAYAHLRRQEAHAALALVGVPDTAVEALQVVDQEASHALVALTHEVSARLERLAPDAVLVHPYEGGHPDHDAAAFAVWAATTLRARAGKPVPHVVEYTSYHRWNGQLRTGEFLPAMLPPTPQVVTHPLTSEEQTRKRKMFDCFGSQAQVLAPFSVETERYRAAPRYDFTRPPHAGLLHYECQGWVWTGPMWRGLAARAQEALGLTP